jgi:hypothetical protein
MTTISLEDKQRAICQKYSAEYCPPASRSKVGLSRDVDTNIEPLNGLRHPPQGDSSGWYIWRGPELSDAEDYFQPMHVEHIPQECLEAADFLALPPGWRFLVAPGHVDVWFDEALLNV